MATYDLDNKRLGEVLAYVKERQDQERPPWVKTNSEKTGYQRTGRKSPGRKSLVDRLIECRVAEANPAALGKQVSNLPRGAALSRLDLLYRGERAINAHGKILAGKIEGLAALLEPLSEGYCAGAHQCGAFYVVVALCLMGV